MKRNMHGINPYMFDCWVDPVVHLFLLKNSIPEVMYKSYVEGNLLTQSCERLHESRFVIPDGLDRGEVLVQEVNPVTLQKTVCPGRLPPGYLLNV